MNYVVSFEYNNGQVENIEFDTLDKAQEFYNESVENNDGEELISLLQGNRELESFSPASENYDEEMYDDDFAKGGMISVEYYSDEDEFDVGEIESFKTEKEAIAEAKKVFDAKDYPYIEVVAPNGEIIKSFGKFIL